MDCGRTFTLCDGPDLPCAYCVGWEDDPTDEFQQRVYPITVRGERIPVLYSGVHPECQKMVDDHMQEYSERDCQ